MYESKDWLLLISLMYVQLMIEIESSGNPYRMVPDKLKNLHKLIISPRRILKDKSNYDKYEDLTETDKFDEELRIRVAPASVDRGMDISPTGIASFPCSRMFFRSRCHQGSYFCYFHSAQYAYTMP